MPLLCIFFSALSAISPILPRSQKRRVGLANVPVLQAARDPDEEGDYMAFEQLMAEAAAKKDKKSKESHKDKEKEKEKDSSHKKHRHSWYDKGSTEKS